MDATPAVPINDSASRSFAVRAPAPLVVAGLLATLVHVSAVTLTLRRAAGALSEPLGPTPFILFILAAAWAAGFARHLLLDQPRQSEMNAAVGVLAPRDRFSMATLWIGLAPSLSLALLLVALSVPGTHPRPVVVATIVLAIEELIVWIGAGVATTERGPGRTETNDGEAREPVSSLPPLPDHPEFEESLYQRIVRHRLADGLDHVEADCVAVFEPGQRHAIEHLAFCPPFAAYPDVHCEQIDGPAARLAVIRKMPYGARIELRLSVPASAHAKVAFRLIATAPAGASAISA